MATVGVRDLKARLSEYLARAASGETVQVTSRGRVVAELSPPPGTGTRFNPPAELLALEDAGLISLSRMPKPAEPPPLGHGAGRASAQIIEDREEDRV